ncbi:MAG TPA: hypothetical protein VE944_26305 [Nostoc sp.]|uniref:hypothetical protein n=1 Tax=Nostoc sp. TaxID=1180 RepID=UPI002D5B6DCB|nr:hypothetical protein [Nostoc sp.]HYX17808.1 hypothetical protein [Nostoc sp.]
MLRRRIARRRHRSSARQKAERFSNCRTWLRSSTLQNLSTQYSVNTGRLVVVIAGSATADILADALRGQATNERAKNVFFGILQYIYFVNY